MNNVGKKWQWLFLLGVLTVFLGVLAALAPLQSGLKFEISIGLVFIAAGLFHALHAFWSRPWGGVFFQLFGAVHYLLVGLMLLANPGPAVTILILLLAMLFIMQGMVQFGLASQLQHNISKSWMLVSGTVAVVLGVLTWTQWPSGTSWLIGVFVGIHLFFRGLSIFVLGLAVRQLTHVVVRHSRTANSTHLEELLLRQGT